MRHTLKIIVAALVCAGCQSMDAKMGMSADASAQLGPTANSSTSGSVVFTQKGNAVVVDATIAGLSPGKHGFHIHEKGDCSAPDATSAGGHFNPTGKPHGDPASAEHHAGDMPMLEADASGHAHYTATISGVSIGGGAANDIVGKSVVVHKDVDDYKSQPAGNSGPRIACGVIKKA